MADEPMMIGESVGFYDEIFRLRDVDRKRKEEAFILVEGDKLPLERNRQGLMRWYLHPSAPNTVVRSMLMYVQELPPHSKSGKYFWQGGEVIVFVSGRGHSDVGDKRYEWEAEDCMLIPVLEDGITVQHSNPYDEPASFVCVSANLFDALGPDLGTGLEHLEDALIP